MSIYIIKAGQHDAGYNFGIHMPNKTVSKVAILNSTCTYNHGDNDQLDINKLYGFSEGANHQYNSVRFGWRWSIVKQKFEILAYVYNNGQVIREEQADTFLGDVEVGQRFYTEVGVSGNYYRLKTIINYKATEKYISRTGSGLGYNLFPYFGGDKVAPHDVIVELI